MSNQNPSTNQKPSSSPHAKRMDVRLNHYHQIIPLKAYHPFLRLDTFPFIIIYISLILIDHLSSSPSSGDAGSTGSSVLQMIQKWNTIFIFPMVLFFQLSLFFWTKWSVDIQTLVGYQKVKMNHTIKNDFHTWTHCLVIPPNSSSGNNNNESKKKKKKTKGVSAGNVGRKEIVPLQMKCIPNNSKSTKKSSSSSSLWILSISYEEIIFRCTINDTNNDNDLDNMNIASQSGQDYEMDSIWKMDDYSNNNNATLNNDPPRPNSIDRETSSLLSSSSTTTTKSIFHRLHYPTDLPISFYTNQWSGHTTPQSILQTINVYSNNTLKITLPPFIDLLAQQLLAPFFLFQLFCVLLWCLDEYWYYALFTLFTLVLFECTVAHTRLRNLSRLRETLRLPFGVWVYRCHEWNRIMSHDLVVGDVISLSSDSMESYGNQQYQQEHHENGTHVPADLLLLKGSAVVNEAMLTGESVPQMKESIDVVASALTNQNNSDGDECRLDIEDSSYKRAVLFGGTVLVNHSSKSSSMEDDDDNGSNMNDKSNHQNKLSGRNTLSSLSPPDDGCLAMVLRTGFDTQQGSLLRTMVHTSTKAQSDGVNTKDTFLFIVILLLCAVFSSSIVLKHGWNDPTRNRFKLILHVIIIITSVVPPELPMELSLAVTSSLADLIKRCAVYCTEPFRIPLAGMVDTCCFDKTGTLTSDEMVLRGVRLSSKDDGSGGKSVIGESLVLPQKENDDESIETIPPNVIRVMVGCQSLASLSGYDARSNRGSGNIIGDPLEKAVLDGCGWSLLSNNMVAPPHSSLSSPSEPGMINIQHRFAFTSKLKRMTVIATDMGTKKMFALSKGAPETLKEFFVPSSIPESYDTVSRHHMSLGQRVLAMGYKELSSKVTINAWKKRGRGVVESDLIFAGFLVLDCPLKPDSKKVIKELRSTGHDVVMITGDAVLTAAEVARQVGIIDKSKKVDTYELRQIENSKNEPSSKFAFVPIGNIDEQEMNTKKQIAYSQSNLKVIREMLHSSEIAGVCVAGDTLTKLAMEAVRQKAISVGGSSSDSGIVDTKTVLLHPDAQSTMQNLVPLVSVFARHAPRQKEAVIAAFNGAGRYTMMCGDGTNDVGALKMSHVGISIISVPDVEAKQRDALSGLAKIRDEETKKGLQDKKKAKKRKKGRKKAWEDHVRALSEAEDELNNVSLGDASVASPFTSRVTSIRCTKDVLQRGRCTLVTMLQIYKILGVNCLVNALVLSSLHLAGAKQGDTQLTAVGLVVAGLFFFVTKGQPLDKLSKQRPPSSILTIQAILSIVVQFSVHFICIMGVTIMSKGFLDPKYDPSLVPDGAFNPNTLNTATFLITVQATVNTFVVNYRGRPFMEDLKENKLMMRGLQVCYGLLFVCAMEVFPPINDLLQLAPLPTTPPHIQESSEIHYEAINALTSAIGFKSALCLFMVADTVVAYLLENALVNILKV